jgi:AhpD family alkylhydroperoxidase
MQSRLEIQKVAPQAYRAMAALETYVRNSGLEEGVILLIKLRASQINGCSYCIDMHTKDARANGESEQRLYALSAWRETPFFTDRERAALNWTEALTLISQSQAPDSVYAEVCQRFTELELVNLTMTIVTINGWNRICVGFRKVPGTYEPNSRHS